MDTWEFLNSVYEPLLHRVQSIGRKLVIEGYTAKWSWYNLHASRRGDEYKVEYFPIPVIDVGEWCDVIIELESICVYLAGDTITYTTGADFGLDGAFTCF